MSQTPVDVFNIHNGVVDQFPQRNRNPTKSHNVDRKFEITKDDRGDDNRHRNRNQRDHGRSHVQQKQDQNNDHQNGSVAQCVDHVADRGINKVTLLISHLQPNTLGRRDLQFIDRRLDSVRNRSCVCPRLLLNRQDDSRKPVDRRIASLRLSNGFDFRHVLKQHRSIRITPHHDGIKLIPISHPPDASNQKLLRVLLNESAVDVVVTLTQSGLDILKGHVKTMQFMDIDQNVILFFLTAHHDHF